MLKKEREREKTSNGRTNSPSIRVRKTRWGHYYGESSTDSTKWWTSTVRSWRVRTDIWCRLFSAYKSKGKVCVSSLQRRSSVEKVTREKLRRSHSASNVSWSSSVIACRVKPARSRRTSSETSSVVWLLTCLSVYWGICKLPEEFYNHLLRAPKLRVWQAKKIACLT